MIQGEPKSKNKYSYFSLVSIGYVKSWRAFYLQFFLLQFSLLLSNPVIFAQDVLDAEDIAFEMPRIPPSNFQNTRASAVPTNSAGDVFWARLRIPGASQKIPAAVLIHTCHGETQYLPWIKRFNDWGIATLSFSRCQPPDFKPDSTEFPSLDWWRGVPAANGALKYLASREEIDIDNVVLIAWSRLGIVPLSALNPEGFSQFSANKYAAAVAFYPFCSFARGPHSGPILVLSAEHDDWIDTKVCLRMGRESQNDTFPVRVVVLNNAVHGFDIEAYGEPHVANRAEINPDGFPAAGGTIGYDTKATIKAIDLVRDFLKEHIPL